MPATTPLRHPKECRRRKCNTGEIPHATLRKSICIFEEKVLAKNIIECSPDVDLNVICKQMGRSPDWMPDILLRADGYETNFYKKD